MERDRLVYPPGHVEQTRGRTTGFVPLLVHANRLVTDTEDSIWMSPDGDRAELPDRQPVGSHTDPTGETAIDPRREHLKAAIHELVYDKWLSDQWSQHLVDLNDALHVAYIEPIEYATLKRDYPRNLSGRWDGTHATLVEYTVKAPAHITALADHSHRPVRQLARHLHRINNRLEQRVRNAQLAFTSYHGGNTRWSM